MTTFVIAEGGVNHTGRLDIALRLTEIARECGADAIKWQAFSPEILAPGDYKKRAMLKALALTRAELTILAAEARHQGIEFMCTPMDEEWLKFVIGLGVKHIKIGSGQTGNRPFMRAVGDAARTAGLPVIVSNGIVDEDMFTKVVTEDLWSCAVTVMSCVSKYPTPLSDVRLSEIRRLKREFPKAAVGFSSHCAEGFACAAAVAAGATVIEAHLKMGCGLEGPDMSSSLMPEDFAKMVTDVRGMGV